MNRSTSAALHVENAAVVRERTTVVREISFDVAPGEILTILGPNGAGKTSLLEGLAGVVPLATGVVALAGRDVRSMSRSERARAGLSLVEQGRTVFPTLSTADNIEVTGAPCEVVEECFELFPALQPRRDVPARLLSGGEQQMLVLARAIACRPSVLMLDEMSLGLAPIVVRRLLPVVRNFADQGMAVLLVEQFATLALQVSDHAVVLAAGRMTYSGDARLLLAAPERLHEVYLGATAE